MFCADLIPGRPWVHLPVTMGYDRYPELLIDEKRAFLEDKLARGVRLFFTHDVGCAIARVARDAKGRFSTADEHAELVGEAGLMARAWRARGPLLACPCWPSWSRSAACACVVARPAGNRGRQQG